ncbi:kunitz-type protease inhibitor 1 isoform X1 [Kryptolebias marmoratus]|uniref:Kunitz-type protease inhibitor 1-like n=1 Tax=Kryptolebias marmoratus TaxID=37003 RepID=A0A3Q3G4W6_KRYMA|nr:kunitz-type protease inhibitor 1 isoform X1 [Kryptolebias marmoratus]
MFQLCSSSPLSLLLLLLLLLSVSRLGGASDCAHRFRSGEDNFVLDAKDAVMDGAALLSTESVHAAEDCEGLCCQDSRCNLALLEPRAHAEETRTCVLFDCVHKNRFVCRFVNQAGYKSFIREAEFRRYLQAPGKKAPPIANAGRDVIIQPGENVELNGIESLALHGAVIDNYRWNLESGDSGVKMETTDHPDQVKLSNLQAGLYIFQLTVTDSKGESANDRVSVLVLSPALSASYCLVPVKVGPCRAAFKRWRYDATTESCKVFTFGGCKPNKNNFLSDEECLSACRGITASSERNLPPPAAKECGSPCRPDQLACDTNCCLNGGLECDGVKQCSDASDENGCSKLNETFSELLSINITDSKARCTEPPRTGPCRARFPRWYYDPLEKKCYSFVYGGCHGNGNSFDVEAECKETCEGVTERNLFARGIFERFEMEDEGDSGSISLAVILSVAACALLAVLGYCFLRWRRKNRSHHAALSSPAQVQPSEQDTLVYNSTTKPL